MWLAFASALVVLLASGVAVSRLSDRRDGTRSAAESGSGSGSGSGPVGSGPETVVGAGEAAAAAPAAGSVGGQNRLANSTTGEQRASTPGSSPAGGSASSGSGGPNTPDGSQAAGSASAGTDGGGSHGAGSGDAGSGDAGSGDAGSGGGSQGDGQSSPPAPNQQPPGETPLVAASVSAGEGASGGVVGIALDSAGPDADVTLGTTPLVGNHPPSQGTGITFGGRFLQPPPGLPLFPG